MAGEKFVKISDKKTLEWFAFDVFPSQMFG